MDRSIGELIREARIDRGLTQAVLAKLLTDAQATASHRLNLSKIGFATSSPFSTRKG